jgi:hypothetical protein
LGRQDDIFLSVPFSDLENYIESQPISDDIKSLCYVLNQQKNNCYQWTAIDQWGMSLNSEVKDEVFFNRNFTLIEQMIIADIFYENHGENPFSIDSEVKTILAYGKDNVGLLLIDLPSILLGSKVLNLIDNIGSVTFIASMGRKCPRAKILLSG